MCNDYFLVYSTETAVSLTPASQLRICLMGTVVDDPVTVSAAQTFGVPVISSETGAEIIGDTAWTTYFIMNDFDGPIFKAIQKTKHRLVSLQIVFFFSLLSANSISERFDETPVELLFGHIK